MSREAVELLIKQLESRNALGYFNGPPQRDIDCRLAIVFGHGGAFKAKYDQIKKDASLDAILYLTLKAKVPYYTRNIEDCMYYKPDGMQWSLRDRSADDKPKYNASYSSTKRQYTSNSMTIAFLLAALHYVLQRDYK